MINSNNIYLYGEADKIEKGDKGIFHFNKSKFMDYNIVNISKKKIKNLDLYLLEKNNTMYQLALYKKGILAPKEKLLQLQTLSKSEENNLAPLVTYGFSEEFEKDYSISKISEFGSLKDRKIVDYDRFIKQIINALEICHKNDIIHYNLTPENIIIESINPNDYKIIGFGYNNLLINSNNNSFEIEGLEKYQAPEIAYFNGQEKSDFWSLGVILYEMFVGVYPFKYTKNNFGKRTIKFSNICVPDHIDIKYKTLIEGLLIADPQKRWGITEIKKWFNSDSKNIDFISEIPNDQFFSTNKEHDELEELHRKLAYTPLGYGELEKLYFRGDITSSLTKTHNYDLLEKIEENLSDKYQFNSYLYKYTTDERRLYFKGYDLSKFENLKMLTDTDVNKLIKFLPPIKKELISENEEVEKDSKLKLNNKNRIDKTYFFYGYINNKHLYINEKKASTLTSIPNFNINSDKNILNFIKLRNKPNYDLVNNHLRDLLNKKNPITHIKNSIRNDELQLKLLNSNIIEEASVYINSKADLLSDDFMLFKRLYKDYNFLNLPFEKFLTKKNTLSFYNYFVEKSYGTEYFNQYEKLIKLFTEETLLNYFSYKTLKEFLKKYPELKEVSITTEDYIKFQVEALEHIYKQKLYLNKQLDCSIKVTIINKLFKKLIGA